MTVKTDALERAIEEKAKGLANSLPYIPQGNPMPPAEKMVEIARQYHKRSLLIFTIVGYQSVLKLAQDGRTLDNIEAYHNMLLSVAILGGVVPADAADNIFSRAHTEAIKILRDSNR